MAYLLENGARCDASTFDGERCIYGALTDQIRKMLIDFNVITARVKRREPFHEFLRRLLEEGIHSDITFNVNGTNIKAHRFILAARSVYFEEMLLDGKWQNRNVVTINNSLVSKYISSDFFIIVEIQDFRFYVKSILANQEVLKLTFFVIFGGPEFVSLANFILQKVQKIKIQSL